MAHATENREDDEKRRREEKGERHWDQGTSWLARGPRHMTGMCEIVRALSPDFNKQMRFNRSRSSSVIGQSQTKFSLPNKCIHSYPGSSRWHGRFTASIDHFSFSPSTSLLDQSHFPYHFRSIIMTSATSGYRPELLAPYHRLDQGDNIQAECMICPSPSLSLV